MPAGPPPNTNSDLESLYNWLYYEDSEEEENPFRVNEQPLFNYHAGRDQYLLQGANSISRMRIDQGEASQDSVDPGPCHPRQEGGGDQEVAYH